MKNKFTPFNPPVKFWTHAMYSLMQLVTNGLFKSVVIVWSYFLIRNLSIAIKQQQLVSPWLIASLLVIAFTLVVLRIHERYVAEKMSQKYINRIRSTLLKRIMRASIRSVQNKTIGNLSSRLAGDLSAVKRWLSLGIARLITHSLLLTIVLGFILSINIKLGALMIITVLGLIASSVFVGQLLKKTITNVRRNRIKIHSLLVERISSIVTIRAMGKELPEVRKINRQAQKLEKNITSQGIMLGLLRGIGDASGFILIALLFAFNAVFNNSFSVQEIAALISLVLFLNAPIRELGRVQEYYQGAKLSFCKLEELFDIPRIIRGNSQQIKTDNANGTVHLKDVQLAGVFNKLNFHAKAGEHVAITGENGSGKSTVINILLGLLKADKGTVLINNINPNIMKAEDKANNIGVSGVNISIIRGSLKKNLTYRNKKYDAKDFQELLQFCQLNEIINKLPNGLNSKIKENGNNFSTGEKARISLFRALLGKPSLLILDEPESNLDAKGLVIIESLLEKYQGTILIATHHKKLISLCHKQWNLAKTNLTKITLLKKNENT